MLVVKIGGPAYRIGMGGGAASSVPSGSNRADLDYNAVQVLLPVSAFKIINVGSLTVGPTFAVVQSFVVSNDTRAPFNH